VTPPEASTQSDTVAHSLHSGIVPDQRVGINGLGANMARRRFQRGSIKLRIGKNKSVWVVQWREDEIHNGQLVRVPRKECWPCKDYPTKKLAQRALDERLARTVNSPDYRPRPTATFAEFADKWTARVLSQQKPSSQASSKTHLRKYLMPTFATVMLRDINTEMLQAYIADWQGNPKTLKNVITTMQSIWASARQWDYVNERSDPFDGLKIPKPIKGEQPKFTLEQLQQIIQNAVPPYDTVYWLVAETGIRRGELCALNVDDVKLDHRVLIVRKSCWGTKITTTKSQRPRLCKLSPELTERLQKFVAHRQPDQPLFLTKEGKRLHPDNFVKRHLKPLLKRLGLEGAMHAFRHGNATLLDGLNTPMKVRMERLGHVDESTTMNYTHLTSSDEERLASELGRILQPGAAKTNGLEGAHPLTHSVQ